ncbi:hypothetical protein NPX13_g9909 [Xylaria arbuscula]|uniref:Uncharacterized protein n=1 Tax=Xylaria arbuscula TaxID=114810 RepID=A0A9W8N5T5_9PEZI|nr:hypothetical protein NPX13_g9909 [Xylaria arbuscula]
MDEIITAKEAAHRRAKSYMAQRKDVYLFALNKFSNPDSFDKRMRGPPLEVDGEFKSGPIQFINHLYDPNFSIFARVSNHAFDNDTASEVQRPAAAFETPIEGHYRQVCHLKDFDFRFYCVGSR